MMAVRKKGISDHKPSRECHWSKHPNTSVIPKMDTSHIGVHSMWNDY